MKRAFDQLQIHRTNRNEFFQPISDAVIDVAPSAGHLTVKQPQVMIPALLTSPCHLNFCFKNSRCKSMASGPSGVGIFINRATSRLLRCHDDVKRRPNESISVPKKFLCPRRFIRLDSTQMNDIYSASFHFFVNFHREVKQQTTE